MSFNTKLCMFGLKARVATNLSLGVHTLERSICNLKPKVQIVKLNLK